ncbi:hypothetical protein FGO68_gene3815 [Halteria grandinella]|uniref:Uncharacterized protein n=1 Tax=Halteria grandinella TaxID=5974 RepID=A0A8J8T3I9_HALGN|nr:hypothetical protein FGO68_gene3815 [Halteria grandinella]
MSLPSQTIQRYFLCASFGFLTATNLSLGYLFLFLFSSSCYIYSSSQIQLDYTRQLTKEFFMHLRSIKFSKKPMSRTPIKYLETMPIQTALMKNMTLNMCIMYVISPSNLSNAYCSSPSSEQSPYQAIHLYISRSSAFIWCQALPRQRAKGTWIGVSRKTPVRNRVVRKFEWRRARCKVNEATALNPMKKNEAIATILIFA